MKRTLLTFVLPLLWPQYRVFALKIPPIYDNPIRGPFFSGESELALERELAVEVHVLGVFSNFDPTYIIQAVSRSCVSSLRS